MHCDSAITAQRFAVRSCTAADIGALLEIETNGSVGPWSERLLVDAVNGEQKHTLAAIDDTGKIVGFCCYQTILDESEIHNIVVAPELRRTGIGALLLEKLFERLAALGVKKLFLEVRESNISARSLYTKKGFAIDSKRKAYYSNGEDAFIMSCHLKR